MMPMWRVTINHGIYQTRVNQRARGHEEAASQALLTLGFVGQWDEIIVAPAADNLISIDSPPRTSPDRRGICA